MSVIEQEANLFNHNNLRGMFGQSKLRAEELLPERATWYFDRWGRLVLKPAVNR